MLKIYKIAHDSKIYGPGIRDVIRFKGCSLHCKNCINPELWSTRGAKLFSVDEAVNQLKSKHLTLLGGEPLQQEDILPDMSNPNYLEMQNKLQICVMLLYMADISTN